jgi:hypothetical protein
MGREADDAARFRVRTPTVMWDEIGGEIVAINLGTGHYFSLRDTAHDAFRAFAHGASLPQVVDLVADGVADPAVISADLEAFVEELVTAELVEPRAPDDPPPDGAPWLEGTDDRGAAARAYAPPRLETYTDLEDLMLLDPVHDVDGTGWPSAQREP